MPFFVAGTAVLTKGEQCAGEGRGWTVGCVQLEGTGGDVERVKAEELNRAEMCSGFHYFTPNIPAAITTM